MRKLLLLIVLIFPFAFPQDVDAQTTFPDLYISKVEVSSCGYQSQLVCSGQCEWGCCSSYIDSDWWVDYKVTIKNNTNVSSGNYQISEKIYNYNNPGQLDYQGSFQAGPEGTNGETTYTRLMWDGTAPLYNHGNQGGYIELSVDSANQVTEDKENNNGMTKTLFDCQNLPAIYTYSELPPGQLFPDLVVSQFTGSVDDDGGYSISFKEKNTGYLAAPAHKSYVMVKDYFGSENCLPQDWDPGCNGWTHEGVVGYDVPALNPNTEVTVVSNLTRPGPVEIPGRSYSVQVCAIADGPPNGYSCPLFGGGGYGSTYCDKTTPVDSVIESSESNNETCSFSSPAVPDGLIMPGQVLKSVAGQPGLAGATIEVWAYNRSDWWNYDPSVFNPAGDANFIKIGETQSMVLGLPFNEKGYFKPPISRQYYPYFFLRVKDTGNPGLKLDSASCSCSYTGAPCSGLGYDAGVDRWNCEVIQDTSGNDVIKRFFGNSATKGYFRGNVFFLEDAPVCSVTLSPDPLSIASGGQGDLSASVSVVNANVQRVTFASSNTSVATVTSPDNSSPYQSTVTGVSPGSSIVTATIALTGGATCSGTSGIDTSTVNIITPTPWWQVKDSDVLVKSGNLSSQIPVSCTTPGCLPYFNREGGDDSNRYPGVIIHEALLGSSPWGSATNPTRDPNESWLANTSYNGRSYTYSYFAGLIPPDVVINPITDAEISGGYLVSNGNPSHGYVWFRRDGDLTINGTANLANRKVVLLVNGNLNLGKPSGAPAKIRVNDGSGFFGAFVSGNISINPASKVDQADPGPVFEGLYFAEGSITTGTQSPTADGQLWVRGSLVAPGGVTLQRNLSAVENQTIPAELIEYAPDQILTFPRDLARKAVVWRETEPR